ncbi:MAG: hypothetical protein ACXWT1_11675 [Methylobacter sp.]
MVNENIVRFSSLEGESEQADLFLECAADSNGLCFKFNMCRNGCGNEKGIMFCGNECVAGRSLMFKRWFKRFLPDVADWISAYRFRLKCRKQFLEFQTQFAQAVYGQETIRVLSGPFVGMFYFNDVVWGAITPKWLGSYEEELHEVMAQEILTANYNAILDVGAAEGYYAVGLARACPNALVYSFDIAPYARKLQRRLAELNHVRNLRIGKRCTHREINRLVTGRCLIIADIEGFEYELLDPEKANLMKYCDLLVEVHGFNGLSAEQVQQELCQRFASTHRQSIISSRERSATDYERICGGRVDLWKLGRALEEYRGTQQNWFWLKAKYPLVDKP